MISQEVILQIVTLQQVTGRLKHTVEVIDHPI